MHFGGYNVLSLIFGNLEKSKSVRKNQNLILILSPRVSKVSGKGSEM